MNIKSICRSWILVLILIWTSLIFILPWGGPPTVLEGFQPNFHLPHALGAESHHNRPQAAVRALSQQYVTHELISITNNADFAALGFPGAGIEGNPYVIEGLNITGSGNDECLIRIQGTTAYFIIRNNFLALRTLNNVTHGTIDSNIVTTCADGIYLLHSGNTTVAHNTVSNCRRGIYLGGSNFNTLTHNTVSSIYGCGIYLGGSGGNNTVAHNTVTHCKGGIELGSVGYNTIFNNTVAHNTQSGIGLWGSGYNTIFNNTVAHNTKGISLVGSDHNTVAHNAITHNSGIGLSLSDVRYPFENITWNMVTWNDFLGNYPGSISQASDTACDGCWMGTQNVFANNYWDDHDLTDLNDDGIADVPYPIKGLVGTYPESWGITNYDLTPLTAFANPHFHLLSTPFITYPNGGETLQGTVTLHWAAASDSWEHSVTYAVSYSVDNGSTWTQLAVGLSTPRYKWDTTAVAAGSAYRVQVVATCSEGLTAEDRSDASFTIQIPEATTTSPLETTTSSPPEATTSSLPSVGAFPTLGCPVGMLLATLILATILMKRIKRKTR